MTPPPPPAIAGWVVDNPILVKHLRSRLRFPQLMPVLAVTGVMGGIVLWLRSSSSEGAGVGIYAFVTVLQGAVLILLGGGQVASAITRERQQGILDFHRVSPLPPSRIAVGFLLGAPIREYAVFACTLPFALVLAVAPGGPGILGFASCTLLLLLNALFVHSFALLGGLGMGTTGRGGGVALAPVVLLYLFGASSTSIGFPLPGLLTAGPGVADALGFAGHGVAPPFFGVEIPLFLQSFLYQVPLGLLLFLAAVRKTRSERLHAFSRPGALASLLVLAFLGIGACWMLPPTGGLRELRALAPSLLLYGLGACALVLSYSVTPTANDFANGVRRAARAGAGSLGARDDHASNRVPVALLSAVLLMAGTVLFGTQRDEGEDWMRTAAPLLTAAFAVAAFGFARQYFELAFPRRVNPYFALFLFGAWVLPLLVAAVLGMTGSGEVATAWMSASPIAGIFSSSMKEGMEGAGAARIVAPCASGLAVLVFHFLCVAAEGAATRHALRKPAGISPKGNGPAAVLDAGTS